MSKPSTRALLALFISFVMFTSACSEESTASTTTAVKGDGGEVAYGQDQNVIVTDQGTYVATGDPGSDCVQLEGEDTCIPLDEVKGKYCGEDGAQVDIIVIDGEATGAICYPSPDDGTPVADIQVDADGNPEVPQNQNGTVVTFPEETNGEPLKGDVTIDAERITIYGNGPDDTIFEGNMTIASNNSRVRGVTIQGNLIYAKNSNNSAVSFCRIHGNLEAEGNGFRVVDCQIFGDVTVTGNDALLVAVGVGGDWNVSDSAKCDGCYSITDEDMDFKVADTERGDEIKCGGN